MRYPLITIIYNPNSTGPSHQNALELRRKLKQYDALQPVRLRATKQPGHAEVIAYRTARRHPGCLLVSASGDGGYNEVVNGAMRAYDAGFACAVAVLPSGNANDHASVLQHRPLLEAITAGAVRHIDILEMTVTTADGSQSRRYAHSYIGLGLTPVVAAELNKQSLNALKELVIVLKTFRRYRPFKIVHGRRTYTLDSVVFANIQRMAKVLTLDTKPRLHNGKFSVHKYPHGRKLQLLLRLATAAAYRSIPERRVARYAFRPLQPMPVQLDGEVLRLKRDDRVVIRCRHDALTTVY